MFQPRSCLLPWGEVYISTRLDTSSLRAELRPLGLDPGYYTRPIYSIQVSEVSVEDKRGVGPLIMVYGDARVRVRVEGYIAVNSGGSPSSEHFYEDPVYWEYWTKALMVRYPNPGMSDEAFSRAIHALMHALIHASRPVAGAYDTDLGGVAYPTGHVIIYDSAPGGNGVSRIIFERMEEVEGVAEAILATCGCGDGCPRCVYSPHCGLGNRLMSRRGALRVLRSVYEGRVKRVDLRGVEGRPMA